jgi:hypothetical protein
MRMLSLQSWSTTSMAHAYLVLGRVADAQEQAKHGVLLARAQRQRGWEGWGLKLLGDVHAHEHAQVGHGTYEQAEEAYRRALTLATVLGMRPLVVQCHFGLWQALRMGEQAAASTRAFDPRHNDVPRHGHAILAGAG